MSEFVEPVPRLSPADVAAVAMSMLDTQVIEVRPVAGYVGNQDFLIIGADDRYVLKAGDGEMLAAEAWACDHVRAHGVPAPRIVGTDLAGAHLGIPFLAMQCVPGSPSPSAHHPALIAAGRQLRRVHSITARGFGRLRMDGAEPAAEHSGWGDFTETAYACLTELLSHRVIDVRLADQVRTTLDRHRDAMSYDGPPVLLHGDLHPRHLFATEAHLTGIIDWGDVMAGDPLFDLARYSIGGRDTLPDVLEGYGLTMSSDLHHRFALYRMIRMTHTLRDELRAGGDWFDAYRKQLRADLSEVS